jgi:hypothetical protein
LESASRGNTIWRLDRFACAAGANVVSSIDGLVGAGGEFDYRDLLKGDTMTARSKLRAGLLALLAAALAAVPFQEAFALITGGVGNAPMRDPGWPEGAAAVFNIEGRVAYWEGPPFGGGQYHAECRGDAKALNAVLEKFAKMDVKSKTIVVHDGVGHSFWLNPNRQPGKVADSKIDWTFMVWVPDNWQRLRQLPADLNPTGPKDAENGPPSQIDIYTGGSIRWADVVVPKGVTIDDRRLEAHGFTAADGVVLEGKVTDLANDKPLAAKVRLELVEPQPKGGYKETKVVETTADAAGRWVLKKTPAGWYRIVVESEGYVSRVAGYARFDAQPRWQSYQTGLSRPASVAGKIVDENKKPLADVEVRIGDTVGKSGGRYETAVEAKVKTAVDGTFRVEQIPIGSASIWVNKAGYVRPGLGPNFTTPKTDFQLTMMKAAKAVVTVDFGGKERPKAYIVDMAPEGGNVVGSYGGSGHINDKNQMIFDNVPPGRYIFRGHPNPTSDKERSEGILIELKGGQTTDVTITAK